MSTIPIPFIGDIGVLVPRIMAEPDKAQMTRFMQEQYPDEKGVPSCVGMFWPHGLELLMIDPDYYQDLFITHNSVFTK